MAPVRGEVWHFDTNFLYKPHAFALNSPHEKEICRHFASSRRHGCPGRLLHHPGVSILSQVQPAVVLAVTLLAVAYLTSLALRAFASVLGAARLAVVGACRVHALFHLRLGECYIEGRH